MKPNVKVDSEVQEFNMVSEFLEILKPIVGEENLENTTIKCTINGETLIDIENGVDKLHPEDDSITVYEVSPSYYAITDHSDEDCQWEIKISEPDQAEDEGGILIEELEAIVKDYYERHPMHTESDAKITIKRVYDCPEEKEEEPCKNKYCLPKGFTEEDVENLRKQYNDLDNYLKNYWKTLSCDSFPIFKHDCTCKDKDE